MRPMLFSLLLAGCAGAGEFTLHVQEPVTVRVVGREEFDRAWGPGPHFADDGSLMTNAPSCFFESSRREIVINKWRSRQCPPIHELCHAAGKPARECLKVRF